MTKVRSFLCILAGLAFAAAPAVAQVSFEEALIDVGNVGITVTNAGFVGNSNIRNNPTGIPSFEYPLDSGIEHLFEAGLWVGAVRSDGIISVRSGAVTASSGYAPGATGYEFAQLEPLFQRSTLPTSDAFTRQATSHLDYFTAFEDTSNTIPGTAIAHPDPGGALGLKVEMLTHAWNFPFTESFAILDFNIINISDQPIDSVYVGMYHDIVVRNINTTNDAGGSFFNKGGYGFIDSLQTTYGFNAGGTEETLNTYGSISILGAEWPVPGSGERRFFFPTVADEYVADGLTPPSINPRMRKNIGVWPPLFRIPRSIPPMPPSRRPGKTGTSVFAPTDSVPRETGSDLRPSAPSRGWRQVIRSGSHLP